MSWRPEIGDMFASSFHEADEQSFFPGITNRNECRALNCFLHEGQCQSDFCWGRDDSWEFEHITCDITNAKGSPFERYFDDFGIGCYCRSQKVFIEHECCLDGEHNGNINFGESKNCINDLSSSQHPCNNIKGGTWDDERGPLLRYRPCCTEYGYGLDGDIDKKFDRNLPCTISCSRTYSFFNAANRIKYSGGGRPRG